MELTNKKIILIITIIVIILAVFTGISTYKYLDSSNQNKQPYVSKNNNTSNANAIASTVIASSIASSPETPTPTINTVMPTVNADQSSVNASTMSSPTPTVTVSVAPPGNLNNGNSGSRVFPNLFNNSACLDEKGRVNVQVYILNNIDEIINGYMNSSFPFLAFTANMSPVSDARMSLMKETYDPATRVKTEELVNMPNNPLTASNCIIQGKPGYSFANVPPISGDPLLEDYTVRMEKNGRIWSDLFIVNPSNGEISEEIVGTNNSDMIPSDLMSGTIYGRVRTGGANDHIYFASGANVTLYHYPSNRMVNVSNNPQVLNSSPEPGFFEFNGLQPGLYNVTVEKGGTTQHMRINLTGAEGGFNVDLGI